ncbi:14242_t:CDS:2 [Acaulospora colombiana]|uniref:14242_t:CDS:1 n=1 Tax=Acaulospora colombiana TaxID=27376 RepID=A0ACA9MFU8_9GLOM|nr:14242_t:CDS:2 [Acaulospora colombiana]
MSREQANELQDRAHEAEVSGDYPKALELQTELATVLPTLVANGEPRSDEGRRDKERLEATRERIEILRNFVQKRKGPAPKPLPSKATVAKEMREPPSGTVLLSKVETDHSAPLIVASGLPNQPDPNQVGSTYITPLLSTSIPDTVYHVYKEIEQRYNGMAIFLYIKGEDKVTYYTLSALKRFNYQISEMRMSRAAEYGEDCVVVDIDPINPKGYSAGEFLSAHLISAGVGREHNAAKNGRLGRSMTFRTTATSTPITETLDGSVERKEWWPRRFTYGNRRFVWRREALEGLFEVEKEWSHPDDTSEAILDQTHGRSLLTSVPKLARKKLCTINIVGGLDQQFREYLLASHLAPQIIMTHGHTDM